MSKDTQTEIKDVQSSVDKRGIRLNKVGVRGVEFPIQLKRPDGTTVRTVAEFNFYADLPAEMKGTHMSRFVEALEECVQEQDTAFKVFRKAVKKIKDSFKAEHVHLEAFFTYFIEKESPATKKKMTSPYHCGIIMDDSHSGFAYGDTLLVKVPVTTVCPCSLEISDQGAHNQRAHITLTAEAMEFVWFEDLINLLEPCGSCEIYPLLKRPDEKYVTEKMFDNPKFVEDVVRDAAVAIRASGLKIPHGKIECESQESIHNHTAYAKFEW